MAGTEPKEKAETDAPPPTAPNLTVKVKVSEIKTVKVSNISKAVGEKDIWEFFSFSGNIHYIQMKSDSETTQHAFVTFRDPQGAETAALLTGATMDNLSVLVTPVEGYQLPPEAPPLKADEIEPQGTDADKKGEVVQKAEDVVSTMLAKGYVLGKDALKKAQSFDERHQLTSNASNKVASLDEKMGISKKLSMGKAAMNEKMKEVDERFQVTEATKSALAAAEQKATSAGQALMQNRYVSSGALLVSGAISAFAKAAEDVGSKTKEKVEKAEEEKERTNTVDEKVEKAEEEKESRKDTVNEKVEKAEEEKERADTVNEKVDKAKDEKEESKDSQSKVDKSSNEDSNATPSIKPTDGSNSSDH